MALVKGNMVNSELSGLRMVPGAVLTEGDMINSRMSNICLGCPAQARLSGAALSMKDSAKLIDPLLGSPLGEYTLSELFNKETLGREIVTISPLGNLSIHENYLCSSEPVSFTPLGEMVKKYDSIFQGEKYCSKKHATKIQGLKFAKKWLLIATTVWIKGSEETTNNHFSLKDSFYSLVIENATVELDNSESRRLVDSIKIVNGSLSGSSHVGSFEVKSSYVDFRVFGASKLKISDHSTCNLICFDVTNLESDDSEVYFVGEQLHAVLKSSRIKAFAKHRICLDMQDTEFATLTEIGDCADLI